MKIAVEKVHLLLLLVRLTTVHAAYLKVTLLTGYKNISIGNFTDHLGPNHEPPATEGPQFENH